MPSRTPVASHLYTVFRLHIYIPFREHILLGREYVEENRATRQSEHLKPTPRLPKPTPRLLRLPSTSSSEDASRRQQEKTVSDLIHEDSGSLEKDEGSSSDTNPTEQAAGQFMLGIASDQDANGSINHGIRAAQTDVESTHANALTTQYDSDHACSSQRQGCSMRRTAYQLPGPSRYLSASECGLQIRRPICSKRR